MGPSGLLLTLASPFVAAALALAASIGVATPPSCPPAEGWGRLEPPIQPRVVRGLALAGTLSVSTSWDAPDEIYIGALDGLYRTDDCGGHWAPLPTQPLAGFPVLAVATTPRGTVLAALQMRFVFVSADRGQTWQPVSPPGETGSVIVTNDGGRTWRSSSGAGSSVLHISVSPAGVVYATLEPRGNPRALNGVGRSDDGGHTWRVQPKSFTLGPVAADALDPDTVYLISGGLRVSRDAGATFERIESFTPNLAPGDGVSALTMSADGARFWVATFKGYLFRSPDRGETWEQVQNTAYAGYLVDLSASPFDSGVLFALTNTGALWAYREPESGALPLERSCQVDAVLGFGRIWRTETLPRGDAGCPLESERPVAIYQMPSTELERYRVDYTPDYWLYVFGDGSWGTFDKATHPLPATGVTTIFGSIQRFEAATMVWVPKPGGSRVILVLQDRVSQEFAD